MSAPATAPRALLLSEPAFNKQIEAVQQAHASFKGICDVPSIGKSFVKLALIELVDATVRFPFPVF